MRKDEMTQDQATCMSTLSSGREGGPSKELRSSSQRGKRRNPESVEPWELRKCKRLFVGNLLQQEAPFLVVLAKLYCN